MGRGNARKRRGGGGKSNNKTLTSSKSTMMKKEDPPGTHVSSHHVSTWGSDDDNGNNIDGTNNPKAAAEKAASSLRGGGGRYGYFMVLLVSVVVVGIVALSFPFSETRTTGGSGSSSSGGGLEKKMEEESMEESLTSTMTEKDTKKKEEKKRSGAGGGGLVVDGHFEVLEVLDHDKDAFTQGLTFYGGKLYEGTGLNGESQLRQLNPQNPTQIIQSHPLPHQFFGEGIAHFHDRDGKERIIQLTWQEHTGFIYDAITFDLISKFKFQTTTGQGWGITYDDNNKEFIVSDGSHYLHFWDRDFYLAPTNNHDGHLHSPKEVRPRVAVHIPQSHPNKKQQRQQQQYVKRLNELEFVNHDNTILSNVWYDNRIYQINIQNGVVMRIYDFEKLYTNRIPSADCFNGIAITDVKDELFVTGKLWPKLYRVKLLL